jgi:DNA ligase-1
LSKDDAIIIERIIGKDLKIGLNTSTVNKVWPKFIEETPYMGAIAFNQKKALALFNGKREVYSQVKMDGRYANTIIDDSVTQESRGGEITHLNGSFDFLLDIIKPNHVLNGELTMDGYSRYTSNGIIASIVSINKKMYQGEDVTKEIESFFNDEGITVEEATDKIVYTVWDMITLEEYADSKSNRTYIERLDILVNMLNNNPSNKIRLIESLKVNSYAEAMLHFKEMLMRGEEGTIIKGSDCKFKDGKPNEQIKLKMEFSVDLRIIGFNQGTKGTRLENTLGSLQCESEDGLLVTDPAGITDKMRDEIWNNRDNLLGTYAEVTCSGISETENGFSLLHPRLTKLRDDKFVGDTLENIKLIEEGIKQL